MRLTSLSKPSLFVSVIAFILFFTLACCYESGHNIWSRSEQNEQAFLHERFGRFLEDQNSTPHFLSPPKNLIDSDSLHLTQTQQLELMESLYARRADQYKSASESMTNILEVLLVMLVVGLFILFFQPKEVEIPIVNFKLPDKLFYVVVPFAIVYLFFQLGLAMNAAIDSRLVLEIMTDEIEKVGHMQVSYYHSNARTLVDGGLIDSWCAWHYDVFRGGRMGPLHKVNAFGILFMWLGTFIGLMLAVCLTMISLFLEKYRNTLLSTFMLLVAVGGFLMWSVSLLAWYQHSGFLIAWMWGSATLAMILWNKYGRKYSEYLVRRGKPKAPEESV